MVLSRPPEQLRPLAEHLGRLKHDLGKYICFRQRWLPPEADEAARYEALRADLMQTRSGPAGSMDARQVWNEFAPWFEEQRLDEEPDGAALVAALHRLWPVLDALDAGERVDLAAAAADCREVSEKVRTLHAAARAALRSLGDS